MKNYLVKIKHKNGAVLSIGAQTDNDKPIFIYWCGKDTGRRYVNIGSAARHLEKTAEAWGEETEKTYGTASDIPVYGCSEWNKALFRYWYCGSKRPAYPG